MTEELKNTPPEIAAKLRESLRRIRRILWLRGSLATLATLIACMLSSMAVDAMITIYASWIRWLIWSVGFAATSFVAWTALVRPLRRKITLTDVALLIERNHPELEERLSTVVELGNEGRGDDIWSKSLVNEITRLAIRDIDKVTPRREFTTRTVKPRLLAAAGVSLVLVVLFAAFPSATARLIARALVPSAEVDNVYASSLKVAPGDKTILQGTSFEVNLAVEGGFPSRAFVRTSVAGRRETSERMVRTSEENSTGPAYYTFAYPSVTESFTYRVNCGSALTRSYSVKVVPTPTWRDRQITVTHPAYTGRPADTYTNRSEIVGVAGSEVTVTAVKDRDDIAGALVFTGGRCVAGTDADDGRLAFRFTLEPALAGAWVGEVWDGNGFSNRVEKGSVTVAKDAPPEVRLVSPEAREIKLPRSGLLTLDATAKDDFGVADAALEICVGAGEWKELREVAPTPAADGTVGLSETVLVESLGDTLGKAATFQLRYRVRDNLPADLGGPGVAQSEAVLVQILAKGDKSAKSQNRQELAAEIQEAKKTGEEIRKFLAVAYDYARDAAWHYKMAGRNGGGSSGHADTQTKKAKEAVVNAEGLLGAFIDELAETRLDGGVKIFRPVLDGHVVPTRQAFEDVFLGTDVRERTKPSEDAREKSKAALRAFDDAMRKFGILTKAAEDMQALADLAEREKALAEAAEKGEMDAKELSEAEKALQDELSKLEEAMPKRDLADEMKKAEQLAQRAEELAKRQDEIRKRADESIKKGDAESFKNSREEQAKLAQDVNQLVRDTVELTEQTERETGTPEMDDNRTSEPMHDAQNSERNASDDAQTAAEALRSAEDASRKSAQVSENKEIDKAREALAEANAKAENAQKQAEASKAAADAAQQKFKANANDNALKDAANQANQKAQQDEKAAREARQAADNAQRSLAQAEAAQNARDSSKSENGELAQQKMDAVSAALRQTQSQLAEAQARMAKKNAEFAEQDKQLDAMMEAMAEAQKAIQEAMEAAMQGQQQEGQQDSQQQDAQQQAAPMTAEQIQQMIDALKAAAAEMLKNGQMTKEQFEQLMQQLQAMKDELGKLSPEALKAQLEQMMKGQQGQQKMSADQQMQQMQQQAAQKMSQMQNQLQQMQQSMNPAQMNMAQKMQQAAQAMQQQLQNQLQQNNMAQEPFMDDLSPDSNMPPSPNDNQKPSKKQKYHKLQKDRGPKGRVVLPAEERGETDWFRMKSSSGADAEADRLDDVPSEYRGLVREYFRALREGAK